MIDDMPPLWDSSDRPVNVNYINFQLPVWVRNEPFQGYHWEVMDNPMSSKFGDFEHCVMCNFAIFSIERFEEFMFVIFPL